MGYHTINQLCDDQSTLLTSTLTHNHLSRKNHQILICHSNSSFLPRGKSIPKTALLPAILSITKHQSNKALRLRANTDFDSTRPHRQRNNRVYPKAVCINYTRGKKVSLKYDKYFFIISNII